MSPIGTTTLADAQAASARFAADQVAQINAALIQRFTNNFTAWREMVIAGKIPNTNPPQPPKKWVPQLQSDGYTYEALSELLVCDPRTDIPEDQTKSQAEKDAETGPSSIRIGVHLNGAYWQALTGDTCSDGFRTPPMPPSSNWPAGSVFQKVMSPFGGWWLKVN